MNTPFHMIILGMTACGKTHYLLKMLEEEYKNHFDYIFIVCPTFKHNETYQNWKYLEDPKVFALPCDHDEGILREIVKFATHTNSVIILDDCAASQSVKKRTSELVKLAFHGKHMGLSTIVITQQLTSIAKPYREQMSKIVSFYNPDAEDEQVLFMKYMAKAKDKDEIMEKLEKIKYARLEITLRVPRHHKVVVP